MKKEVKKQRSTAFKVLRVVIIVLLAVIVIFGGLIGFLSATEFKPADTETLEISGKAEKQLKAGDSFSVVSWNIGYGALGDNADFFMDGGKHVNTASKDRVNSNIQGVTDEITELNPDIFFIQETDIDSSRSKHINEYSLLQGAFNNYNSSFANNFKVSFLPYPIPPIGKVDSGIATFSSYPVTEASRVQLPVPFSWPVSMVNLKRCLLVSKIDIEGSDKQLVLVNLHLEAYDDGAGKTAQTKMLADFLNSEADKGNYVIAGGDFNQIFSIADTKAFPAQEGKWQAGEIAVGTIDGDWQFLMDWSAPSCRSLDQPYENANQGTFQYYLIDGFIVSGNITVDLIKTQDLGFVVSDHNPVLLKVTLNNDIGEE